MCSGLCEIKDTGDSALASSEAAGNIWALLYPPWTVQTNLGRKYPHRQRAWHWTAVALGRSVKSRQHVQRHITRATQAEIVFCSRCLFFVFSFKRNSRWFWTAGNDAFFFLNCCSSRSGRNLNPVLVCRGRRTPSGEKKKIYGWNVSALFHISLIRQNKKAITLGQKNTGHGLLTFYHGRHILTGALKVVTHSSAWGRLIELPAATKWGLHPLRVEMNCNLFRPCCSQETKWVWAGEGG